ncbi:MAG: pentapeptide repeat-containing protein [Chloroflexi bacterium]|nr:pentapeptide repeat-containing protein [Chloroflexota bacterium]
MHLKAIKTTGADMPLDRDAIIQLIEDKGSDGLDLSGHDLSGADLSGLDLHGVNFSRANLLDTDLRWANLRRANLSWSVLQRADLRWADLSAANLNRADLRQARLWWTEMADTNLQGADLASADMATNTMPPSMGNTPLPGAPVSTGTTITLAGWQFRASNAALAATAGLAAALVYFWGVLYSNSYYQAFGIPSTQGFFSPDYLSKGIQVVWQSFAFLLMLPLLLLYALIIAGILLVVPFGFIFLGDRLLSGIRDERYRWGIILALFLGYLAAFQILFPRVASIWTFLTTNALPASTGFRILREGLNLSPENQAFIQFGLLALMAGPLYLAFRYFTLWLHAVDPAQYPQFQEAILGFRRWPLTQPQPVSTRTRRVAWATTAALLLLIPTFLTQTGSIQAQGDMCNGGPFAPVSLLTEHPLALNAAIPPVTQGVPAGTMRYDCLRLLYQANNKYYVFYPHESRLVGDKRVVKVYEIPVQDIRQAVYQQDSLCPLCTTIVRPQAPTVISPTVTVGITPTGGITATATMTATAFRPSVQFTSTANITATLAITVNTPTATGTPRLTATVTITPTPNPLDKYEPDDLNPPSLGVAEIQKRTFYPANDVDWAVFSVIAGHIYTVKSQNGGSRVLVKLEVDLNGRKFTGEGSGRDNVLVFEAPVSGVALLKITNGDTSGYSPPGNDYEITMTEIIPTATITRTPVPTTTSTATQTNTPTETSTPTSSSTSTSTITPTPTTSPTPTLGKDYYEPNNTFLSAYGPLQPDVEYKAFLWNCSVSSQDLDYYWFNVTIPGVPFDVYLWNIPNYTDYDLYLYGPSQNELARSTNVNADERISWTPAVTGTYYALIFTPNQTCTQSHPYSLAVKYLISSPTPTVTPTSTATPTPLIVPRPDTPTVTPGGTPPTVTQTRTPTPSRTVTTTGSPTPSNTSTSTATVTATSTSTSTSTSTATATGTTSSGGGPPTGSSLP